MTLIMPDGYEKWQQRQEKFTPGRTKRKKPIETGYPVLKSIDRFPSEVKEKLRFVLPNWYCVDCKQNKQPTNEQGVSVHIAEESDPSIDIKKGEVIVYFLCAQCIHDELWAKKNKPEKSVITGEILEPSMAIKRWQNAVDFVRSLSADARTRINPLRHGEVR